MNLYIFPTGIVDLCFYTRISKEGKGWQRLGKFIFYDHLHPKKPFGKRKHKAQKGTEQVFLLTGGSPNPGGTFSLYFPIRNGILIWKPRKRHVGAECIQGRMESNRAIHDLFIAYIVLVIARALLIIQPLEDTQ